MYISTDGVPAQGQDAPGSSGVAVRPPGVCRGWDGDPPLFRRGALRPTETNVSPLIPVFR